MNILFVDTIYWNYTPDTVYERPFGGHQSGVCYLTESLGKLGHKVALMNHVDQPTVARGVMCIPMMHEGERLIALFQEFSPDVVVVVAGAEVAVQLKTILPATVPTVLWSGHGYYQAHYKPLEDPLCREAWDAFAFVGTWQLKTVCERFGLDKAKAVNLGMAISPKFENLFSSAEEMVAVKTSYPTMLYASTPERGLSELLRWFPRLKANHTSARLEVYSSLKVYQLAEADDPFKGLYELCQRTDGVDYIGSVPQPELATCMRRSWVLAYPNTVPETACIVAMEAMASGAWPVTSVLGALPETTAGFGSLIDAGLRTKEYEDAFVERVDTYIEHLLGGNSKSVQRTWEMVQYANANYVWSRRAKQWEQFLGRLL
ncbi:MAG: glycosyltransferase [Myxococcota bacterium]|nr:glycosyltransferase [Myxococcota bacterium]